MCSRQRKSKLSHDILGNLGDPYEESDATSKEQARQEEVKGYFSDELRERIWQRSQARAKEKAEAWRSKHNLPKRAPRLPRELIQAMTSPSPSPMSTITPHWIQEQAMAFTAPSISSEVVLRGNEEEGPQLLIDDPHLLSSLSFEYLLQLPSGALVEISPVARNLWQSERSLCQGHNYSLGLRHSLQDGGLSILRYDGLYLSELLPPISWDEKDQIQIEITTPEELTKTSELLCILWNQKHEHLTRWLQLTANRDLSSSAMDIFLQFLREQEVEIIFLQFDWQMP